MFNFGVVELLINMISANLTKPEASAYKQIYRSVSNISTNKSVALKLVDNNICALTI